MGMFAACASAAVCSSTGGTRARCEVRVGSSTKTLCGLCQPLAWDLGETNKLGLCVTARKRKDRLSER
eukprot:3744477-Prymnesium_polylepis.1